MSRPLKTTLLLAALCPALAAAEPVASSTPEQCRTVLSEFAMFEAFIAACPRVARAEIDTRTRLNNVYEGFEWREPGCSMCLAMNADRLAPKERCASTSNRNFEGRQGNGGRTHLVSPAMAAAAAVAGHFVDVRAL